MADNDFSHLLHPLIVNKDCCKRIIEDSASLIKAHPVFSKISVGLLGVLFEYQRHLDTFP